MKFILSIIILGNIQTFLRVSDRDMTRSLHHYMIQTNYRKPLYSAPRNVSIRKTLIERMFYFMKNSEKIDINLEEDSLAQDEALTEEERCPGYYETALRYINIATYMKQYEDQDKYYHRALVNLRKARKAIPGLKPLILDVVHKKYYARASGKIALYNEACSIRDNAATPTDYLMAQTLFDRIHRYEIKHQIREDYTPPDLLEQVARCTDSEQQAEECGRLAEELMAKQKKRSLISSGILLLVVIAILAFSRTIYARILVGELYAGARHYNKAWQHYQYVYDKTKDERALKKYEEFRYRYALSGYKTRNREDIRDSFRELARLGYKDSEKYLVSMEKARIAELPDGEKIRFGEVNWRILTHDGGRVLLLKDKTQGQAPYQKGGGATDWEHSSLREWLNTTYIDTLFSFPLEQEALMETTVPSSDNPVYGTEGGNETKDKLFLLSDTEFQQYADLVPKTHYLWWLRTPGNSPESTSIVSTDKEVMSYGYDTGSEVVKTRPAIWVDVTE